MSSLLAALRKLAQSRGRTLNGSAPAEGAPPITWETVESVQENGYALVQGKPLAATGTKTFEANERVPVAWKGGRPQAILGHRWRRAQFGQTFRVAGTGIVEELLIGNFDNVGDDVWYRNFDRLEKLGVAEKCNGGLLEVRWGYDGKSFVVKAGDGWYYIFTMERDETKVEETWEPKLAWSGQPLIDATQILSIKSSSAHRYKDIYGVAAEAITNTWEDQGQGFGWYRTGYNASFETEVTGGGAATGSAFRPFTLAQLLAGQTDGATGTEQSQVVDFYLDGDGKLKFLISVSWEHFTISSPNGAGTRSIVHWNSGDADNDGYQYTTDEDISSIGASATVGGVKQDLTQVPEQHFFIYEAVGKIIEFSTFPATPEIGQEITEPTWGGRIDHVVTQNLGGPSPPRAHIVQYYSGAESGGTGPLTKGVNLPPSGTFLIGNATAQLFRSDLAFVTGPYKETAVTPSGSPTPSTLFSETEFIWYFQFTTGVEVRLWHYTVQSVQVFQSNEQPLAFLVMARYPFLAGTGYLNDIPQIGIFIINARTGAVVKTIRDWQFGLAGADLVGGNAHRIVWTLSSPWIQPTTVYYTTNLLTGKETGFSLDQVADLLQTQVRYLQPDFLWDYAEPNGFFLPDSLPDLTDDDALEDLAQLESATGAAAGSTRAANDRDILESLDRWQAT